MDGRKPILCLDFDGVVHLYSTPWTYAHVVADGPVPGAMDFIVRAVRSFRLNIYSSRSNQHGGIKAMQDFVRKHMLEHLKGSPIEVVEDILLEIEWPIHKPPAQVTIDDRAWRFEGPGHWPMIDALLAFKPWNKQ